MANALQPVLITPKQASVFIQGLCEPSDEPFPDQKVRAIIHRTLDAKVHTEASLMQWISTHYVGCFFFALNVDSDPDILPQDADSHLAWPIGIGKKCCEPCWLLHQKYND